MTDTTKPITGTDENNTLYDTTGDDKINAGDGDDTVYSTEGSDTVRLGDGDDTLVTSLASAIQESINLTGTKDSATDTYYGGDGQDTLVIDLANVDNALSYKDAFTYAFDQYIAGGKQSGFDLGASVKEYSIAHNLNLDADFHMYIKQFENINFINYNTPPYAIHDHIITTQGTEILYNVLSNDYDLDGDVLSIDSITQPTHGYAEAVQDPNSGKFYIYYLPDDPDFSGTDSLTYTVSDGKGGTDTTNVEIRIEPPPGAKDNTYITTFGKPIQGNVILDNTGEGFDTAAEGSQIMIATLSSPPEDGYLSFYSNGRFIYQPKFSNPAGTDSFTYTITDDQGNTDTATVNIIRNFQPENTTFPYGTPDYIMTKQNSAIIYNILGNDVHYPYDPSADQLVIHSVTNGQHGKVSVNPDNTITYTPDTDYLGNDYFYYTVSDGTNPGANPYPGVRVNVYIDPTNFSPTAISDVYTTNENEEVVCPIVENDYDLNPEDSLQLTGIKTQPEHGTLELDAATKTIKYKPNSGFTGQDSFQYAVTDTKVATEYEAVATVKLDVRSLSTSTAEMSSEGTAETFVFSGSDFAANETSTITNFNTGDTIQLESVFEGLSAPAEGSQYTASDLSGYITTTSSGGDTTITIDTNGGAAGGTIHNIVLQGVTTDLEALLANNQINIVA